jgi:hypothetical protein
LPARHNPVYLQTTRYFVIGNLAESDEEVIRYAGLLRGTESAVQAVSASHLQLTARFLSGANLLDQYGLSSVSTIGQFGNVYLNFALWAIAIVPGWLVIKDFGASSGDKKLEREARRDVNSQESTSDSPKNS